MAQVNVQETNNNLSKLINMREDGSENNVIISKNVTPAFQMALLPNSEKNSIIGMAKGKFHCPEDIHQYDDEISELFEQS